MTLATFARKLIVAVAYGSIIGSTLAVLFYGMGAFVAGLNPSSISASLMAGFGFSVGFGGTVAVALSEDLQASETAAPARQ